MGEVVVEIRGLRKRFGRFTALDGLDLVVNRGEVFGLLGENGAGKTTALGCLLGLLRRDGGEARVFGVEASAFTAVASRVGVSFEHPSLHRFLTGLENLEVAHTLAGRPAGRRAAEALELVGLERQARKRVRAYSRGMQQRLSLARALLGRPELLVLDEPLSGLDPLGVESILDLLLRLRREEGATILVSSHQLHELERICDSVALLHAGRVVASGSVGSLLRRDAPRMRIRASPRARALAALRAHPVVRSVEAEDGEAALVAIEEGSAARLNGDLVRAGLEVSEFAPLSFSLSDFYLETVRSLS